jgi:hypothetical protein
MAKMGDRSRGFVNKAYELVQQYPELLPRTMSVEQVTQNVEIWGQMESILFSVNQLQELINDTYVALGSQVYTDALMIYQFAKSVNHTGTLEQAVTEMGKRFSRKGNSKKGKGKAPGEEKEADDSDNLPAD